MDTGASTTDTGAITIAVGDTKSDHITLVQRLQPPQVAAETRSTVKTGLSSAYLRRPAAVSYTNLGCSDLGYKSWLSNLVVTSTMSHFTQAKECS